jgi:hypothetical protein
MAFREIELDEALEKYKKAEAEKPNEARAEEQKEFETVRKEKKLKKPGSISRFFNQFGIGKYWERLNDYFEQEEKLEKEEAERKAGKETAEDIRVAAEEKVSVVKEKGREMPTKILESAARVGAGEEEAAPVIAEVKAEEAAIEKEAEAAKIDLGEEIEILEKGSMEDELREEYKNRPTREVDARIKNLESNMGSEKNPDMRELLEAEKDILAEIKKEKEKERVRVSSGRKNLGLPVRDEGIKTKDLPPGEEFEAISKEHEVKTEMEKASVQPVALREPKKVGKVDLPPGEEFEAISKEHEVKTEMEKAKVEPIAPGKMKNAGKELPPEWEEVKPATISAADRKKIETGNWAPKISAGFQDRQSDISAIMEESFFFAKGEKDSKARLKHMLDSLEKVGEAYTAQKAAKEISAADEKALKKWIAETKGAMDALKHASEMKPVKVVELKKRKPAKRRAA